VSAFRSLFDQDDLGTACGSGAAEIWKMKGTNVIGSGSLGNRGRAGG
jgi:hypothetical protein